MRIGIITVPFNNNYGGFLQAYALKHSLTQLGNDVIFINRERDRPNYKILLKRFIKKCLSPKNVVLFRDKKKQKLSIYTKPFVEKYLYPRTQAFLRSSDLHNNILKYNIDCFITGSDQVWRYAYAKKSIKDYFFNFLDDNNIPRFSYAASFGTAHDEYPENEKQKCSLLLKKFIGISVREDTAADILRKDFNVKIPIKTVLDPTLLVDSKEYINLINNYGKFQIPSKAYLFCYILDNTEEKQNIIQKIKIDMGVENVYLSAQSSSLLEKEPIRPIEEWLAYIHNSKFVITDSYHGMLFSIIFRKPFLVYGNQNRGIERFTSILNKLGLTSRLITSYSEFNNEILYNNIDWRLVYNQLNFLQQESLSFLHSTLNSIRS